MSLPREYSEHIYISPDDVITLLMDCTDMTILLELGCTPVFCGPTGMHYNPLSPISCYLESQL